MKLFLIRLSPPSPRRHTTVVSIFIGGVGRLRRLYLQMGGIQSASGAAATDVGGKAGEGRGRIDDREPDLAV